MLFSGIPRARLWDFPTPLMELMNYGKYIGHQALYIKRDDLIGLGQGGNKVRSLEFQLGEALAQGADIILAAGGLQSNQVRLAAAACGKLGLECILVHNAHEPLKREGNMLLNHLMGVRSVFLGPVDEEIRGLKVEEMAAELGTKGRRPYIIKNSPLTCLGYANAALELHTQADQAKIDLRHVVIVGAMAATAAGFVYGTGVLGAPYHVHVISVEYDKPYLNDLIRGYWEGMSELTGVKPSVNMEQVMTIHEEYLGPGYAAPTPESTQAIYDLARLEGIFLDTVYNSKTLWGLKELVARGIISKHEATCFIHTGGVPSLFAGDWNRH